jgi:hypothetical protein
MELQITFQEREEDVAFSETLEVTSLNNGFFRLEHSPLFNENVHYGDIVELEHNDKDWLFIRIVESSNWHHFNRILTKSLVQSELFELWLESITKRGGFWEVAFGGVVFISYPRNSPINVEVELQEIITKAN